MLPEGCRIELYGPNVPQRYAGYMVSITQNGSFITGAHRTSIEGALHDLIAAMPEFRVSVDPYHPWRKAQEKVLDEQG